MKFFAREQNFHDHSPEHNCVSYENDRFDKLSVIIGEDNFVEIFLQALSTEEKDVRYTEKYSFILPS